MTSWKGEITPITNEKAEELPPIITNDKMVGDHDDNADRELIMEQLFWG